jgi:hypothetical protein
MRSIDSGLRALMPRRSRKQMSAPAPRFAPATVFRPAGPFVVELDGRSGWRRCPLHPVGADVRYKLAVAARRPCAPGVAASFTKGEVNRAGVLLLDLRGRMRRDGAERAVKESDEQRLEQAWAALTWWRGLHARPLSTLAANLRYHVDRGDARVRGRIEVTQRLKRLDTLIGKLGREPGNVTQMQDMVAFARYFRACDMCTS